MFRHTRTQTRCQVGLGVLQSLALAKWIVQQTDITEPRQALGKGLVGRKGFPVGRMAARSNYRRPRKRHAGRQIQVCRDRKTRSAFKEDLFDPIRVAFDGSREYEPPTACVPVRDRNRCVCAPGPTPRTVARRRPIAVDSYASTCRAWASCTARTKYSCTMRGNRFRASGDSASAACARTGGHQGRTNSRGP